MRRKSINNGSHVKTVRSKALAGLTLSLLFGATIAVAQDEGVTGGLERTATTTPEQKLQYSADGAEEIAGSVKTVQKLVDDAERGGDPEQVECLTSRLSQLRRLSDVVNRAGYDMKSALETGETERANFEFRKIGVALSRSRQLVLQAEACTEDSGLMNGETVVRVEGDVESDQGETDPLKEEVLDQGYDPPQESPFN